MRRPLKGFQFKGKLGMSVRKSIKDELGGRSVEPLLADLSPDAEIILCERFIASQWYRVTGADEVLRRCAVLAKLAPEEFARRVGCRVAYQSAGKVGRTVLSLFGSPERLARYFGKLWSQLYDSGKLMGDYDEQSGKLTVFCGAWGGHGPILCNTTLGSLETLARAMRGPPLISATRTACVSEGAGRCRYEFLFDVS